MTDRGRWIYAVPPAAANLISKDRTAGLIVAGITGTEAQQTALSSLKGRGFVNRVVDQWFCWLSASG